LSAAIGGLRSQIRKLVLLEAVAVAIVGVVSARWPES